jgi:hypothetical protein
MLTSTERVGVGSTSRRAMVAGGVHSLSDHRSLVVFSAAESGSSNEFRRDRPARDQVHRRHRLWRLFPDRDVRRDRLTSPCADIAYRMSSFNLSYDLLYIMSLAVESGTWQYALLLFVGVLVVVAAVNILVLRVEAGDALLRGAAIGIGAAVMNWYVS